MFSVAFLLNVIIISWAITSHHCLYASPYIIFSDCIQTYHCLSVIRQRPCIGHSFACNKSMLYLFPCTAYLSGSYNKFFILVNCLLGINIVNFVLSNASLLWCIVSNVLSWYFAYFILSHFPLFFAAVSLLSVAQLLLEYYKKWIIKVSCKPFISVFQIPD